MLEEIAPVPQPERSRRAAAELHELFLTCRPPDRPAHGRDCTAPSRPPTDDPAFAAEPITEEDLEALAAARQAQAERAFTSLEQRRAGTDRDAWRAEIDERCWRRTTPSSRDRVACTGVPTALVKTRLHGDYHLGQVLVAKNDSCIIDFEGEPAARSTSGAPSLAAEGRRRHAAVVRLRGLGRGEALRPRRCRARQIVRSGRWHGATGAGRASLTAIARPSGLPELARG